MICDFLFYFLKHSGTRLTTQNQLWIKLFYYEIKSFYYCTMINKSYLSIRLISRLFQLTSYNMIHRLIPLELPCAYWAFLVRVLLLWTPSSAPDKKYHRPQLMRQRILLSGNSDDPSCHSACPSLLWSCRTLVPSSDCHSQSTRKCSWTFPVLSDSTL